MTPVIPAPRARAVPGRLPRILAALALAVVAVAPAARAGWPLPPLRTGLLYVSGYSSNAVGEYLPDGTLLRTITVPGMVQPRGVAVDAEGNLIVVCQGSQRILRLDLYGNVLQTITHPDLTSGTGLEQSPNGDWYVGNFSPGRVLVFDAAWNHVTTIQGAPLGLNGVNCVSFDPSGDFAVTAAIGSKVFRFDATHALLGVVTHPGMASPMSIARDSQGDHYVSNGAGTVGVIKFDAAWSPLTTFGTGVLSGPQGIAVDEHDRLTITNFYANTVHRYDTQGTLLGGFPLLGVNVGRNLAWQTSPRVLARAGSVDAGSGYPVPILSVSGQTPDVLGRIAMGAGQPFQLDVAASPAGPQPAPYVLYLHPGEPGTADVEELPGGAGLFAFPTPLSGAAPPALVNSLGLEVLLGPGLLPPVQAPGAALLLPSGAGITGTFTVQALILDLGSAAAPTLPFSASNALVITFS